LHQRREQALAEPDPLGLHRPLHRFRRQKLAHAHAATIDQCLPNIADFAGEPSVTTMANHRASLQDVVATTLIFASEARVSILNSNRQLCFREVPFVTSTISGGPVAQAAMPPSRNSFIFK